MYPFITLNLHVTVNYCIIELDSLVKGLQMAKFIKLTVVNVSYSSSPLEVTSLNSKETFETVYINIDAIEYVGLPRGSKDVITSVKGYVRTKNSDFRVVENPKKIMMDIELAQIKPSNAEEF
jgi:hypothetical protein